VQTQQLINSELDEDLEVFERNSFINDEPDHGILDSDDDEIQEVIQEEAESDEDTDFYEGCNESEDPDWLESAPKQKKAEKTAQQKKKTPVKKTTTPKETL